MTSDELKELKSELTDTAHRLAELYSRCIPYTNDDLLEQHMGNAIESVGKSVEVVDKHMRRNQIKLIK